jgi:hypothetical protein
MNCRENLRGLRCKRRRTTCHSLIVSIVSAGMPALRASAANGLKLYLIPESKVMRHDAAFQRAHVLAQHSDLERNLPFSIQVAVKELARNKEPSVALKTVHQPTADLRILLVRVPTSRWIIHSSWHVFGLVVVPRKSMHARQTMHNTSSLELRVQWNALASSVGGGRLHFLARVFKLPSPITPQPIELAKRSANLRRLDNTFLRHARLWFRSWGQQQLVFRRSTGSRVSAMQGLLM